MLEKMKEIIADQLSVSEDEVTLEASFKDDLDADSLDLFELVMALEEEYDVEIPSDDLAELNTVGDVINYLKDKGVIYCHFIFASRSCCKIKSDFLFRSEILNICVISRTENI